MMKSASAIVGGMPRSPHTAAIAPSMLTGRRGPVRVLVQHELDGADHLDVIALDLELQRHLEQPRRARIARVEAVAEPGGVSPASHAVVDDRAAAAVGRPTLAHQLQPGVEELHAALDVAAVIPAEAEHAGRDARAQRRAGRRRVARASVDGGVAPWSMNETRIASIRRPIAGDGTSPISSR